MIDGVYFHNLPQELLAVIRKIPGAFRWVPYRKEKQLSEDAALFLLGYSTPNLIQMIQTISKKDADVAIIVIAPDPLALSQLKAAIQFAPFINSHVKVVDSLQADRLKDLIVKEAELSVIRKKYKETKASLSNTPLRLDHRIKSTFFDQFLYQAPVGVVLLNDNLYILDANNYTNQLIGAERKLIGYYFPEVFGDQQHKVEKLLTSGLPHKTTTTMAIGSVGEQTHVQLHVSEVISANVTYRMVILLDVTREVQAEEKEREYLARLESHNQELEQFARVLSHDLKSPLSAIQMSGEMASKAPANEKDSLIGVIQKSADNLHHMIEGLEEIIDVRKDGKAVPVQVKFRQVLDSVLATYQPQLKHEDVSITIDFEQVPSIRYIESYLISIFHNMVSNALKYRKKEGPLILTISSELNNAYILVKFSDNGIGIDLNKNKEYLFQPFRRFSSQAQGRGIGLSMIKTMVEKNNGKISVDSQPGVGTTFYCYLCPY